MRSTTAPLQAKNGFTLIEVLLVVALSSMLMLAASSILLTILVGRAKVASEQIIKSEGDYAMAQMEFALRNSTAVLDNAQVPPRKCDANMSSFRIRSIDGSVTTFLRQADPNDGNYIKIGAATGPAATPGNFLTSRAVTLTSGPTFDCVEDQANGNRYVTIQFTLTKNNRTHTFNSSVSLRNY